MALLSKQIQAFPSVTNSVTQNPPLEAGSDVDSKQTPIILWNRNSYRP
jgi:hypothetical protein